MPGVIFKIGGALDPSYKGALAQSVLESKAAGKAIQASLTSIASGNGASANSVGGSHGSGGIAGIIRESTVIVRELAQGRGLGRVAGSVTLLAQYMGALRFAIKSTATEALLASQAATKFSQECARLALAAKGTSGEMYFATQALKAESAAAKAATEANIALASATVKVNWAFVGWFSIIVVAAAAIFYLVESMRAAKNAAKDLADHLSKVNDEFRDGADALKAHHEAMLKSIAADAEKVAWLEKLAATQATVTDSLDEHIKSMQQEFALRKQIAEQNGATQQQILAMEQDQRRKELAIEQAALEQVKKQAEAAKQSGIAASDAASAHEKLLDPNAGEKDFNRSIAAVDYFNSRIPDDVKNQIKANAATIAEQKNRESNGLPYTMKQMIDAGLAKNSNDQLLSTEYGKQSLIGIGDGKAVVSMNEIYGIYDQAYAHQAYAYGQQEKLSRDQALLDKTRNSIQGTAESRAREAEKLQKKVDEDRSAIAAHDRFDPLIRNQADRRSATERERIGIGAPQVANLQKQTLDVSKMQLAEARQLNANLNKLIASGGGSQNLDGW